jgi:predicted SPOUT superfamily RNA methylase MTH1
VKNRKLTINKRFTVRIAETRGESLAEVADPRKISKYWGYKVVNSELTLGRVLRKSNFDLVIATSRHGRPLHRILEQLRSHWNASRTVLIVFGAPTQGLYEILERESVDLEDSVDFVVNTIPWQKVKTVRTEEAVMATLSSINSLFC